MREAVNNHALPIYKKNRRASLLCIFESTIMGKILNRVFIYAFALISKLKRHVKKCMNIYEKHNFC